MNGTDPIDRRPRWLRWLLPPLASMPWHRRDLGYLKRFSDADKDTRKKWSAAVRSRSLVSKIIAGVASGLGVFVWLYFVAWGPPNGSGWGGLVFAAFERTAWHQPWFIAAQIALVILIWFAPCIAITLVCEHLLWHRPVRRAIDDALRRPSCLFCGYDCSGIPHGGKHVTCPECGSPSPVQPSENI